MENSFGFLIEIDPEHSVKCLLYLFGESFKYDCFFSKIIKVSSRTSPIPSAKALIFSLVRLWLHEKSVSSFSSMLPREKKEISAVANNVGSFLSSFSVLGRF